MPIAHFTVGKSLPYQLLDIAQTHISDGNLEEGMNVYRDSLGMPDDLIIKVLKCEGALFVSDDRETVNYTDDPEVCDKFKEELYDWQNKCNRWANDLRERYIHLNKCLNEVGECWDLKPDDLKYGGINNVCALMILGNENKQFSSPSSRWGRIEAEFESDDARDKVKEVVNYKMIIDDYRYLKQEFAFYPVYKFLLEHGLIERIPLIEWYITNACGFITENLLRIKEFNSYDRTDSSKQKSSRINPMLEDFFQPFYDEMMNAVREYFPDYIKWGYMPCDIMDCYDAGYISPEGLFFGANGHENELLHLEIGKSIVNTICPDTKKDPQQYLTEQGWMIIHHNTVRALYLGNNEDYASDPTEEQIDVFCKYINAFYGGKYSTELHPDISNDEHWISTYKLKSADRFCRRDLLNSF